MSRNKIRLWIILSILFSLKVAPYLAQGDQAAVQQQKQNLTAIARMTQSERDRLDRNFLAYQAMLPAKVAALTDFHEKLEVNQLRGDTELTEVLSQYHEWLNTIEPFQRDQLKEIQDPAKRLQLMNEIVLRQRNRNAIRVLREWFKHDSDWLRNHPLAKVPILSSEDLMKLISGIEEIERSRLTLTQQSELNRHDGVARAMLLLDLLKRNTQLRPQDRAKIPPWVVKELHSTFENVLKNIDRLVDDAVAREYLHRVEEGDRVASPELKVQNLLLMSMLVQVLAQQHGAAIPPHQQLEEFFRSLPQHEQDDLLQLEAIDFYKELVTRAEPASAANGERINVRDLWRVFFHSRDETGRWPPGQRGPYGPRESERRPPDDSDDRSGFRGERRPGERLDHDGRPFDDRPPFDRDGPPPRPPGQGSEPRPGEGPGPNSGSRMNQGESPNREPRSQPPPATERKVL